MSSNSTTPRHFKNPPIAEVVCGIQFECPKFSFAIVDNFYHKVRAGYPTCTENPPLPFVFDRLGMSSPPAIPKKPMLVRYFFINAQNTKLIQLQDGRFLFNWRRNEGTEIAYPKFEAVFQEFVLQWKTFLALANESEVEISQTQFELTYMDHILLSDFDGKSWALPKIFSFFAKNPLGPNIDDANFSISLPVEDLSGHLHLAGHGGIRNSDRKPVVILETTVRGNTSKIAHDIESWFDKAHRTIYGAFMDSITPDAKAIWGFSE